MKLVSYIAIAAVAAFVGTAAIAQTTKPVLVKPAVTAPAVTAPAIVAPVTTPPPADDVKKMKEMKSKECSTQADAKKLHGKARKKFREDCKKAA